MPQGGAVVTHEERAGEIPIAELGERADSAAEQGGAQSLTRVPWMYEDPGQMGYRFVRKVSHSSIDEGNDDRSQEVAAGVWVHAHEASRFDQRSIAGSPREFQAFTGGGEAERYVECDQRRRGVKGHREKLR